MIVRYKLEKRREVKGSIAAVEGWTLLLESGDYFDVLKSPGGEYFCSHCTHLRQPSREGAIIEGLVQWFTRQGINRYHKCRSKPVTLRIHRPKL